MHGSHRVRFLVIALVSVLLFSSINGCGASPSMSETAAALAQSTAAATATASPSATPTPQPTATPTNANLNQVHLSLTPFISGLTQPTFLTSAHDGSGRIYILEKTGRILVADAHGQLQAKPFLDITAKVNHQSEMGLLSLAFHPQYATNGLFYVAYSALNRDTIIARFHVSNTPLLAEAGSEQHILVIPQPCGQHKAGMLLFGRDGYLYIGTGDGGWYNPNTCPTKQSPNAQNLHDLKGKILRIDVDHYPSSVSPYYSIPAGNPYALSTPARPEIWAYGFRNPWRFSMDPANGNLFIGDVGESAFEEVDFQPANSHGGENYGWPVYEGYACTQSNCTLPHYVRPSLGFDHSGAMCAMIGGYVYRGTRYPSLQGIYLFANLCDGTIFGVSAAGNAPGKKVSYRQLYVSNEYTSSFGVDDAGEIYLVAHFSGKVYHIVSH